MAGNVYIPKRGFVTYDTGGVYISGFGFFGTGIAKVAKPTASNLLLYGRNYNRATNRGFKR